MTHRRIETAWSTRGKRREKSRQRNDGGAEETNKVKIARAKVGKAGDNGRKCKKTPPEEERNSEQTPRTRSNVRGAMKLGKEQSGKGQESTWRDREGEPAGAISLAAIAWRVDPSRDEVDPGGVGTNPTLLMEEETMGRNWQGRNEA